MLCYYKDNILIYEKCLYLIIKKKVLLNKTYLKTKL